MPEAARLWRWQLLGRTYRVACEDNEREALMQAVAYLDGKMNKDPTRGGKGDGAERHRGDGGAQRGARIAKRVRPGAGF